jgi:hypothetical protein
MIWRSRFRGPGRAGGADGQPAGEPEAPRQLHSRSTANCRELDPSATKIELRCAETFGAPRDIIAGDLRTVARVGEGEIRIATDRVPTRPAVDAIKVNPRLYPGGGDTETKASNVSVKVVRRPLALAVRPLMVCAVK